MRRKPFRDVLAAAIVLCLSGVVCIPLYAEENDFEARWEYTYKVLEDNTAEITGVEYKWEDESYSESDGSQYISLEIPSEIDSHIVSGIAKEAFRYWDSITSVSIPASVKTIGESAFEDCSEITTLKIADGVETIGKRAFAFCDGLKSVRLPDSIVKIEGNSFQRCSDLTEFYVTPDHPVYAVLDGVLYEKDGKKLCVYPYGRSGSTYKIPEDVLEIGSYAFAGCDGLREIELSSTMKKIGSGAFSECTSLTEFTIPDSVEEIGSNPFRNCVSLKKFHISPDQPKFCDIDEVLFDKTKNSLIAFPYNYRSNQYEIPEGVKEIGAYAFAGCNNLSELKIASTVQVVGDHAFEYCSYLSTLVFPEGLLSIGKSAFSGCDGIERFSIPSTVQTIGSAAFDGCYYLKSIEIPSGVEDISENLFRSCSSLSTVIIPEGVKTIAKGAFSYCYSLNELEIPDSVKEIEEDVFEGCSDFLMLIVGRKSKAREYAREHDMLYTYTDADSWLNK